MTREEAIANLKNIIDTVVLMREIGTDGNCAIDDEDLEALDIAMSVLKEKSTDEVVQKIRTAIGVNLYEIASKFDESCGDAAIYLQELIDKAVSE